MMTRTGSVVFPKRTRQDRIRRLVASSVLCQLLLYTTTTTTALSTADETKTAKPGLNVVVISGTSRHEGPPRPVLGTRVSHFVTQGLTRRGHDVTLLDPRQLDLPLLEKPEFAYAPSQVPTVLRETKQILQQADAYIAVTPEYNHAPSPALLNVLNHFGSTVFSFKPSGIVSYSAGQWGGTRAALALRPILSELGCLPVSAMVHVPKAQDILDEDGHVMDPQAVQQWDGYLDRCLSQVEWWGQAARLHRANVDPFADSPAFRSDPSQRNAP